MDHNKNMGFEICRFLVSMSLVFSQLVVSANCNFPAMFVKRSIIGDLRFASELGNYAEYSGAPNEEEVLQYARVVIDCANAEPDGLKRALVVGGGIAKFTDVAATFNGIIRALKEKEAKLKAARMGIYVRRGGPNYQKGLAKVRTLGEEIGIQIEVYGPEAMMTGICKEAIDGGIANFTDVKQKQTEPVPSYKKEGLKRYFQKNKLHLKHVISDFQYSSGV